MNRRLHRFNLFGVLVLAALCALQWRNNRALNLGVNRLEKLRHEQTASLAAQEKTIQGQAADLDDFRARLERALAELKASETRTSAQEDRLHRLARENEALKTNVAEWAAAVNARDARLAEANALIATLAARADEAVLKFNALVAEHNALVRRLNETPATGKPDAAPPDK